MPSFFAREPEPDLARILDAEGHHGRSESEGELDAVGTEEKTPKERRVPRKDT